MAALIIRAIDQQAANAGLPHFAEGDFSLPHPPMIPRIAQGRKPLDIGPLRANYARDVPTGEIGRVAKPKGIRRLKSQNADLSISDRTSCKSSGST